MAGKAPIVQSPSISRFDKLNGNSGGTEIEGERATTKPFVLSRDRACRGLVSKHPRETLRYASSASLSRYSGRTGMILAKECRA
jgi:hypothetical protein